MPKQTYYNSADHISPETAADPYLRPAFSLRNRLQRLVWNICWLLLYRLSPRPFHAWRAMLLRLFGATMGPNCHFYPASQGLVPLEPLLRRPGRRRRRRRNLQPRPAPARLPRHPLPGSLHLRRHPRLRRPRLPSPRLRHGDRPLRLGLRPRLRRPRRQHRRRRRPRFSLRNHQESRPLDGLRRRPRRKSKGPQAPRKIISPKTSAKSHVKPPSTQNPP